MGLAEFFARFSLGSLDNFILLLIAAAIWRQEKKLLQQNNYFDRIAQLAGVPLAEQTEKNYKAAMRSIRQNLGGKIKGLELDLEELRTQAQLLVELAVYSLAQNSKETRETLIKEAGLDKKIEELIEIKLQGIPKQEDIRKILLEQAATWNEGLKGRMGSWKTKKPISFIKDDLPGHD